MKKNLTSVISAIAIIGLSAIAQAETITLKVSNFLPTAHGTHSDFLVSWTKEIEEKTNGQVKFEIYPAGSAFGHVAKQLDQVRAGVVDIAHGLTGIPRGRLPRTLIMDLPFIVKTSSAASQALWDLYEDGSISDDYKGLKMLALHAHNAGLIHTVNKQVKSMDDVKGLRLRTPSQAISMMIKQLGGTPVGMPPTQVYENLSKGVIDGNVFPYDPVASFKLHEVLSYHLDAKAYTTSFYFAMNEKKFKSLPSDVRKVIDEASGRVLVEKFGTWWNEWDAKGLAAINKKGNQITTLTEAQRDEWRVALAPTIDAYLSDLEKKGITDARAIYKKAQSYVSKYE